jgi:tRNA A-37 threonylcarbamoyl transferase component Bud32
VTTGAALATERPPGYEGQRERGAEIVALPSVLAFVAEVVRTHGTLYDWAAAHHDARPMTGRGAAYAVTTPDGPWVVRHYRRGGMIAHLTADRYMKSGAPRPIAELHASSVARARRVRTPQVVAALVYTAGPLLYRGDIATRLVRDANDLADAVLSDTGQDDDARRAAWRAAGELLRDAFDAGVVHPDLNMRNILVQRTPDGAVAHLIDLDRATVMEAGASDVVRRRMLARLVYGVRATHADLAVFNEALNT